MSNWLRDPVAHVVLLIAACLAALPIIGFTAGVLMCKDCSGPVDWVMMGGFHAFITCTSLGFLWTDPNTLTDVRWLILPVGVAVYALGVGSGFAISANTPRRDRDRQKP